MKTTIALLLLSAILFAGLTANGNVADNTNNSTALPTVSDVVAEEETDPPGFEAVFAIAGLLAVAYLVVRQKED